MKYTIGNDAIPWRSSTSTNTIARIFMPALPVFEMLTFQEFDHEHLGLVSPCNILRCFNAFYISSGNIFV